MATKTLEFLLTDIEQNEQENDIGELIQPHFHFQSKVRVLLDEYPNENCSKYKVQFYYSISSKTGSWGNITVRPAYTHPNVDTAFTIYDDFTIPLVNSSAYAYIAEKTFGALDRITLSINPSMGLSSAEGVMEDEQRTLYHYLNGERTMRIKASTTYLLTGVGEHYSNVVNAAQAEQTFNLKLDRAIYPNVASNFTDEGTPSFIFAYSNGKSYIHYKTERGQRYYTNANEQITKIQAALSFDGETADIAYRDIPIEGINYDFALTEAERNKLRTKAQGSTQVPIYYLIKTTRAVNYEEYQESLDFVSVTQRALTIIGAEPIILPIVRDVDATTVNLTGNSDKLIKNHSTAEFFINASAAKGATIVSQSVRCGSKIVSGVNNGMINNVESGVFVFTVTDSRGQTVETTLTKEIIDYVALTCNQKEEISLSGETGANVLVTITGNYFRGNFGAQDNTLKVEIRHTQNDGSMGDWVTLTEFVEVYYNGNSYTMDFNISGLDYSRAYTFQCRAIDKLSFVETAEYTTSVKPIFDWSDKDFNFNVPVTFMGDTMADIVIEEGTDSMGSNGTWYWRKWQSGKAECYGCRNYGNMGVSTAWGSLYRSDSFSQSLPFGLFAQTPEVIDITFRASNFGAWVAKHEASAPTNTSSGGFIVVRPASATLSQAYISFNIIGRWK